MQLSVLSEQASFSEWEVVRERRREKSCARSAYGAAGGTLGTVIRPRRTLFLLFVLWIFKGGIRRQIQRIIQKKKKLFSYLKILVMTAIPVISASAIYQPDIGSTVLIILDAQGFTESEYMALQEFIPENMIRLLTCRCQYLMPLAHRSFLH